MSFSIELKSKLDFLKGAYIGSTMRVNKRDTRNLDNGSFDFPFDSHRFGHKVTVGKGTGLHWLSHIFCIPLALESQMETYGKDMGFM